MCMIIGAVVGGAVANALSTNEPLLVGCTSFGGECEERISCIHICMHACMYVCI
jgi:hypothetical protein